MANNRSLLRLESLEDRTTPAKIQLSIPKTLTALQGETVTVPLNLAVQDGNTNIAGGLYVMTWDPERFTVSNVRLGPATPTTSGFTLSGNPENAQGRLVVSFFTQNPNGYPVNAGNLGATILADFQVKPTALVGAAKIDLEAFSGDSVTQVGDALGNDLELSPAPTNDNGDPNDGVITISEAPRSATLAIDRTFAGNPGQSLTVPVNLRINSPGGEDVATADLALSFDASRLQATAIRIGTAIPGFTVIPAIDNTNGTIRASAIPTNGVPLRIDPNLTKSLFEIDFAIRSNAVAGVVVLDLESKLVNTPTQITTATQVIPWNPAITDAATDAGDGRLTVTAGPSIVRIVPVTPDPRNVAVTSIDVELDQAATITTFTAADLGLKRGSTAVDLSGVTVTLVSGTTYRINGLQSITASEGIYTLTVNMAAVENGAGQLGVGSATEIWEMDVTGPTVVSVGPVSPNPRNVSVSSIRVVTSEGLQSGSLTLSDFTLTRDGQVVSMSGASLSTVNATTYDLLGLGSLTSESGLYRLELPGIEIVDVSGNMGSGVGSTEWTMDVVGPTIVSISEVTPDPRNSGVSSVDVTLSEAIVGSSFTVADVVVRRDGTGLDLSGVSVTHVSPTLVRIGGLAAITASEGDYTLEVSAVGITDLLGNAGTGQKAETWRVDRTAPQVVSVGPVTPDPRNTPVGTIRIGFSEAIDLGSLSLADLELARNDVPIAWGAASLTTIDAKTVELTGLAALTANDGDYRLRVRMDDIRDLAGNAGSGPVDESWRMDATGPNLVAIVPVSPDPRNTAVDSIDIDWNEPIQLSSLTAADLSLKRNGVSVSLPTLSVTTVSGNRVRVSGLSSVTAAEGTYTLSVAGVGVLDALGNLGTGSATEIWEMDVTGPTVVSVGPVSPNPRNVSVSSIRVVTSEGLQSGSLTLSDFTLTRDGQVVSMSGASLSTVNATTYDLLGLGSLTSESGLYRLELPGIGIVDVSGNVGSGVGSTEWTMDVVGPTIVSISEVTPDPRNSGVSSVDVTLSEAIVGSSFTVADVVVRRDGTGLDLSGVSVTHVSPTLVRISGLATITASGGAYSLQIQASGITDLAGNAGTGTAIESWTTDTQGPSITTLETVTPDPRNSPVSQLEWEWSEAILPASLTVADLSLTRDGVGISLAGANLVPVSATRFRIENLAGLTASSGTYTLTVTASGVQDLVGNAGIGSRSETWVMDATAPTVVQFGPVSPDPRNTAVSSIDVEFSEPIDLTSFQSSAVTLLRNGNAIATTAVSLQSLGGARYRITGLAALTQTDGTYAITLGLAGIRDSIGNLASGSVSESWIMDSVTPVILSIGAVTPNPRASAVASLDVTFSRAIVASSFTLANLQLTRDNQPISLSGVTIQAISGTVFRIQGLSPLTQATGAYRLTVTGAGIVDAVGNAATNSLSRDWQTDADRPTLVQWLPIVPNPRNQPLQSVELEWNEPIALPSVAAFQLQRNGVTVPLIGVTVEAVNATRLRLLGLEALTQTTGDYRLRLDLASISDLVGNVGIGTSEITWTMDVTAPSVQSFGPVSPDPRNTAVDRVIVQFNEPILASSFTLADVSLERDGVVQSNAGIILVAESATRYRIDGLTTRTNLSGTYSLRIDATGITDLAGNPGQGSAVESWTLDATPPTLESLTVAPIPTPGFPTSEITIARVTFSEPIQTASFSLDQVRLFRDGQPVALTGVITRPLGDFSFEIDGLGPITRTQGLYELRVLGNVRDTVGNLGSGQLTQTVFIDEAPRVLSVDPITQSPTRGEFAEFRVRFSEPMLNVTAQSFFATRIDGIFFQGTPPIVVDVVPTELPTEYRVRVQFLEPTNAVVVVDVTPSFGSIPTDLAGNPLQTTFLGSQGVQFDRLRPEGRIDRIPGSVDPIVASTERFQVRFTEPVTGVGVEDFLISGLPGAQILAVEGSGLSYILTVGNFPSSGGLMQVELRPDGAFDDAGNPNLVALGGFVVATVAPGTSPPPTTRPQGYAVGQGEGGLPRAMLFGPDGSTRLDLVPFDPAFRGGVRVASGDFNGDSVDDLVVGTGPGTATLVRIYDGKTGAILFELAPFEAAFTGGIFVAAGDLTGDGLADLVISPDEGGGPRCRIFSGAGFSQLADFFGIEDPSFRGGVRPSLGDVNGDGAADLVISAGFGGGPRVALFDGKSLQKIVPDFFLFEPALRNGAYVAAGDLDADGFADLIGGGGPGGGPRIYALSGRDLAAGNPNAGQRANFFGGDINNRGGARVGARDVNGDGHAEILVGTGVNAGSRITIYDGRQTPADGTPGTLRDTVLFENAPGGIFVG
ncbi:Ig-like domain-containing protein [Tuwongella immobilis]|uniref:Uncharacterized protein n=1 Tax=Tuwongella immobilis TaxID=692036 RepID=A0A6C2YLI8_9BACT|nr:Ig-like domain-containing protein [Tuwongella immobilis]VIP02296.1 glycosyl hydrolase : Hemolysin-type calcium-binding region domain protein OS=Rhodopirellula maiorica SM1 GN=RMSM_03614 PE=4 SV=1: Cohesin: Big_5: Big_5 [Tuwongella immobilis]VTS00974.1 glycosyl hydrolase : Hemolysin-type calcium-binding region domain protein OS=Rhodopirellula maiorica SM1 GN=RMSM_03614 PE=4 SV=1: Cohesin: Big_5: Big_5 [Tuwongella immobilis]